MERLPPNSITAEEACLGSIIIDPEALLQVADFLRPEDFYRDAHRMIFRTILDLQAAGTPADLVTIIEALQQRGQLEDVGGSVYVSALVNAVPTSANVEHYGRIVQDTSKKRRLIHAAGKIAALAYNEENADEALSQAQQLIYEITVGQEEGDPIPLAELTDAYYRRLDELLAHKGQIRGVRSGLRDLDKVTGGFQKSDLIIIAGRPGDGKSALAESMTFTSGLRHKTRTLFFSLEMSVDQQLDRLLAMATGIDQQKFHLGQLTDEDMDQITRGLGVLSTLPILIDDTPGLTLSKLSAKAKRAIQDEPIDMIIVDYMQLLVSEGRHENREKEVSAFAQGLKRLARELNIPVIALAQLSRNAEGRKAPLLSDLRESGSIEQESDMVIFIQRGDEEHQGTANLIIAKHRNGPLATIPVQFESKFTLFRNLFE